MLDGLADNRIEQRTCGLDSTLVEGIDIAEVTQSPKDACYEVILCAKLKQVMHGTCVALRQTADLTLLFTYPL